MLCLLDVYMLCSVAIFWHKVRNSLNNCDILLDYIKLQLEQKASLFSCVLLQMQWLCNCYTLGGLTQSKEALMIGLERSFIII